MFLVISVPLTFIRNYTIPICRDEFWDRNRAAVMPLTIVWAFLFLNGEDNTSWGWLSVFAGLIIAILIRFKTKSSKGPPLLITISAVLSFGMSIAWIRFTSNTIMDLL